MYNELLSIKVGILDDPFNEARLIRLNEACILRVLMETLAARIEALFLDQIVPG